MNVIQKIIYIDAITLNEDRHLNNINLINNIIDKSIRPAPIFDNGLSLLFDTKDYPMLNDFRGLITKVKSKPFYDDFDKQIALFVKDNYRPIEIDINNFYKEIEKYNPPFKQDMWDRAIKVLKHKLDLEEGDLWIPLTL